MPLRRSPNRPGPTLPNLSRASRSPTAAPDPGVSPEVAARIAGERWPDLLDDGELRRSAHFEAGPHREQLVMQPERDGEWRAIGYRVRP